MKQLYYILICCFLGVLLGGCSKKTANEYINKGHKKTRLLSNKKGAIKAYSKAIEIDSTSYEAYWRRGVLLKHIIKQPELATKDLQKALYYCNIELSKSPNDTLYWQRGFIKEELDDKPGACDDFLRVGKLGEAAYKYHCIEKKEEH